MIKINKKNYYQLAILVLILISRFCIAEQVPSIELENVSVNIHDKASIERGAKFFATRCMSCHTMIYLRYDPLAQKAGVLYDKMPINVKNWPLDRKPPDLSLEISRRGADWVYTYLHSFYKDTSRPFGVNNLVLPNTAMSGILVPFQGQQILIQPHNALSNTFLYHYQWYDLLELQTPGIMTPEQFDATMLDVVNFLSYASTPFLIEQRYIGYGVIVFLIILFVMMLMLKKTILARSQTRSKH